MAELRLRYHQQLEVIEGKVIQLFALVAEGLAAATEALLTGDRDAAAMLAEREDLIDTLHLEAEEMVNQALALQSPVATDLRFLLSVLRIVPELERSHDLVEHIARRGGQGLDEVLTPRARGLVARMGEVGTVMWRKTADAWYERDASAAAELEADDEEMDSLHAGLVAELGAGGTALTVAMDMTIVARFYERLGDHAVNISRRVVFLAGPRPDGAGAADAPAGGGPESAARVEG